MIKMKRVFCIFILFAFVGSCVFASGKKDTSKEKVSSTEKDANKKDKSAKSISKGKKSSVVLFSGKLKLVVFEKTGGFCLYRLKDGKKMSYEPLYDDRAMGSTNYYSVFFDGKSYRLKKQIEKPVTVEVIDNVVHITFALSDKFSVTQMLSFTDKKYQTTEKLLKVTTKIVNNTLLPVSISLKALFDTTLGEQRRVSLYTDAQNAIFNETRIITETSKDKYITSSNSRSACLFFIKNEGQTTPEDIYIANWEHLQTGRWTPHYQLGRSFSTKNYTNDSAVLMFWKAKDVNAGAPYTVTNLIGFNDFLMARDELPEEVVEKHLDTLTKEERKNYDHIDALIKELNQVKENPDDYTEDDLLILIERIEMAIEEMQE